SGEQRTSVDSLIKDIRQCRLCAKSLPDKPKPIVSFSASAKVLLVGQAPGIKAHESSKPWNDASGIRLRDWMGISDEIFYNPELIAIAPMAFCYPGRGRSGDLPPRPECAKKWMPSVISYLQNIELKLVIGSYARAYFLPA